MWGRFHKGEWWLSITDADETRFNRGEGDPYGSISTEIGMRVRACQRECDRRNARIVGQATADIERLERELSEARARKAIAIDRVWP